MQGFSRTAESLPLANSRDALTDVLRRGAQRMLATAIDAEVAEWIDGHVHCRDAAGHRQVVRNGYGAERTLTTGIGPIAVQQPRVHDRRPEGEAEKFTSRILPPYLRKTKSIEELIPWLYLKGVSTGDFSEALAALLGPEAPGLSASTVTRLKEVWAQEYDAWSRRSLADQHYVYVWVDGVYFNVRLEENCRPCLLVLLGATADGRKELIAVHDGQRVGQAAEGNPARGQENVAQHLHGRRSEYRRASVRPVPDDLRGQVPGCDAVPAQRPRGVAELL